MDSCVVFYDLEVDGGKKRKEAKVGLPKADAELAVKVAQQLMKLLIDAKFHVLDACVNQDGGEGNHDILCERFGDDGAKPGVHSIELKCRTIKQNSMRVTVRNQLQKHAMTLWTQMMLDHSQL